MYLGIAQKLMQDNSTLAYLKYDGKLVEEGLMDLKLSADALYGFNKSLRYFLHQENPEVENLEFEIPVRIEKGSWWASIPENIQHFIIYAGIVVGAAYMKKGAEKMAEKDFDGVGFRDLIKKAIKAMIWVIKIGKHFKSMHKRDITEVEFTNDNRSVKIRNDRNEILEVPLEFVKKYIDCPESLFSQMTKLIEPERQLEIGINDPELPESNKYVRITVTEKEIFYKKSEDEEILFPELKEGQYIELEGHVTRGNENTNTIGFYYKGHVITCYPDRGSVTELKNQLFSNCLIKGHIDRTSKEGAFIEKRPRIRFSDLILLDKPLPNLFSNE